MKKTRCKTQKIISIKKYQYKTFDHESKRRHIIEKRNVKIIRFIDSGGFGCTYEAVHTSLDDRFAIKEFFVKDYCNRDESTMHVTVGTLSKKPLVEKLKNKFLQEARSNRKLKHNGIVRVSDVFEENGTAYYVMDYIEGKSLKDLVKEQGKQTETKALYYIRQVIDALSFVHSKNMLHLDIKPANIMINEDDRAVLIDFGISKQYDEENGENTSTLMGKTPGYAPLEQMDEEVKEFKPATDIYSLGATLYKLLTGITPPNAIKRASGVKMEALPSGISASCKNAIEAAMRLNKEDRPQSINEFLALLDGEEKKDDREEEATDIIGEEKTVKEEKKKEEQRRETPKEKQTENRKNHPWIYVLIAAMIGFFVIYFVNEKIQENKREEAEMIERHEKERQELEAQKAEQARLERERKERETAEQQAFYKRTHGSKNGHEWVDLGLPSGKKWATCNVGAYSPEEYGNYYAWGET